MSHALNCFLAGFVTLCAVMAIALTTPVTAEPPAPRPAFVILP